MLAHKLRRASGGPTVVYVASGHQAGAGDPVTFSTQALGVAAANRHIIVGIGLSNNSRTISGVTVGGVAATLAVAKATAGFGISGFGSIQMWTYIAAVPTGTTGDIVIDLSASTEHVGFVAWAAYGLTSATPTDSANFESASDGAIASSTAVAIPARGIVVAHGMNEAATDTHAWVISGDASPEDVDSATTNYHTAASARFAVAEATPTISCDPTGTQVAVQAAAFA